MKLTYCQRNTAKKSEAKVLRRNGSIPAVIYSRRHGAESIAVEATELSALLRQVRSGRLSTIKFSLTDAEGKVRMAILKEVQYAPTTYQVVHLDFEELHDDLKVNVKIPIEFEGAAECVGVKLGNVLRPVQRSIRGRCLPEDIPEVLTLDVRDMGARDTRRLKDIKIPDTITPLNSLDEVVAVTAKR